MASLPYSKWKLRGRWVLNVGSEGKVLKYKKPPVISMAVQLILVSSESDSNHHAIESAQDTRQINKVINFGGIAIGSSRHTHLIDQSYICNRKPRSSSTIHNEAKNNQLSTSNSTGSRIRIMWNRFYLWWGAAAVDGKCEVADAEIYFRHEE